jgi:hypothetical protein
MPMRSLRLALIACQFAICAPLFGDGAPSPAPPIVIPATAVTEPGVAVMLEAQTSGKVIRWVPISPGCQIFTHLDPDEPDKRYGMFLAPKPGVYKVLAYTAVDGTATKPVYTVITVGESPEPPPIPPGPNPPPVPPPGPAVHTNAWVIVICETADMTKEYAAVLNDKAMFDQLAARGHKWRVFDKDLKDATALGYIAAVSADKVSPPALLVFDQTTRKKLGPAVPLPKTSADFVAAVEKYAGK